MKHRPVVIGNGNKCPTCSHMMERRQHPSTWKPRTVYYFKYWDVCNNCHHIQHYEEAKEWASVEMREREGQLSFFRSI